MKSATARVNGINLAYSRTGTGKPLVLVHGFPLDGSTWASVIPLLMAKFDVIVPDLRGFGQSTATDDPISMGTYANDLAALLDHLGIAKAAVAGHSMGGYVSLAFAKLHPGRIAGLGLVASQAAADAPDKKEGRYNTAKAVEEQGVSVVADGMANKLTALPDLQVCLRDLMRRQRTGGVTAALRAMAEREDNLAWLASADHPVVLVHGDADALIPADRSHEIAAALPTAKLTVIPGAGHMPMLEAPAAVAEALLALI